MIYSMAKHITIREEERTIQNIGPGSKALIIPAEIANNLKLEVGDRLVVRHMIEYKTDQQGSIQTDKDGNPKIDKEWIAAFKKGE